jgi:hypothetical protein
MLHLLFKHIPDVKIEPRDITIGFISTSVRSIEKRGNKLLKTV